MTGRAPGDSWRAPRSGSRGWPWSPSWSCTWVLRGAPIGQAAEEEDDEDAPAAGYRDRVVAAVVAGLLLVVAGAYVAAARSVPWSLPLFALGFGLVLTLIQANRRHRHGSPSLRRTIAFADTALTTTLLARHPDRRPTSWPSSTAARRSTSPASGRFTLSSLTLNQLKSLSRPVTFTSFFGESPRALRQADRVQQLLDLYKAANPSKIRLETAPVPRPGADRVADPARARRRDHGRGSPDRVRRGECRRPRGGAQRRPLRGPRPRGRPPIHSRRPSSARTP